MTSTNQSNISKMYRFVFYVVSYNGVSKCKWPPTSPSFRKRLLPHHFVFQVKLPQVDSHLSNANMLNAKGSLPFKIRAGQTFVLEGHV